MYYLCELANSYDFDINTRKRIFKKIEQLNTRIQINDNLWLQNRWNIYFGKIRNTLLNSENMPHVTLAIATLIDNNNYHELCNFMETFEKVFLSDNSYFSLEIRHNSPFELLYTIFSNPDKLFQLVVGLATIVGVCDQMYINHIKKEKHFLQKNTL